ncbi:hypothetical protein QBC39DRAFT_418960 [Podospora conica]|nr:hypothetical protein QBC39DRAFT_418960 [Schizothecium conicum]
MAATGPTPTPLPPLPACDFYEEAQWAVLFSLVDAIIPAIVPASTLTDANTQRAIDDADLDEAAARVQSSMTTPPSNDLLKAYLQDRPSTDPAFVTGLRRLVSSLPGPARSQLGLALTALTTRPGSLLLTGTTTPLTLRPLPEREALLQSWSTSWFRTPRVLFKTFTSLTKAVYLQTSPLYALSVGCPPTPTNWTPAPASACYTFPFLQPPPNSTEPYTLTTDTVIIGSGPGGAVCAAHLAAAGHSVLVLEKGYHFPPSSLPMTPQAGQYHLFENGGLVPSADGSITVVAGSCWGGGGTVNWSVSLQTQGYVRREWAEKHGLPLFETAAYQAAMDRVCEAMGVVGGEAVRQPAKGRVLLEGARRLGWHAEVAPQNVGGGEHWCGYCHLGCGSGEKQGPAVNWLPRAGRAGARFMEGVVVEEVLWDGEGERRAVGVRGTWTAREGGEKREVVVKAKRVIVAAGALNSPLVLMRSGLKNPHIGQNLHLHPVTFLTATYDEETRPWEGGIITSVCTDFENLDGQGHGAKLESTCMIPYAIMCHLPWKSGLDYKLAALKARHSVGYIALARDRDTGSVAIDPSSGKPLIHYTVSPFDAGHILEGIVGLAKITYVTGAREILPFVPGVEPFVCPTAEDGEPAERSVNDPAFVEWLATLKAATLTPPFPPFTSAHQMGTCRMSSHAGGGVVDPKGRVWGTQGLYVADASVFPSASGVNPMVTVMAIADCIARGVAADLEAEKAE